MRTSHRRRLAAASITAAALVGGAPPAAHAAPGAPATAAATVTLLPASAGAPGDLLKQLHCMVLLWRGNWAVDAMNQANSDGRDAIENGDPEAYNDAFRDFVSAYDVYSDARDEYAENGCGSVTGPFPTAPKPIF